MTVQTFCSTSRKDAAHGGVPAKIHSKMAFSKPKGMLWWFQGKRYKNFCQKSMGSGTAVWVKLCSEWRWDVSTGSTTIRKLSCSVVLVAENASIILWTTPCYLYTDKLAVMPSYPQKSRIQLSEQSSPLHPRGITIGYKCYRIIFALQALIPTLSLEPKVICYNDMTANEKVIALCFVHTGEVSDPTYCRQLFEAADVLRQFTGRKRTLEQVALTTLCSCPRNQTKMQELLLCWGLQNIH